MSVLHAISIHSARALSYAASTQPAHGHCNERCSVGQNLYFAALPNALVPHRMHEVMKCFPQFVTFTISAESRYEKTHRCDKAR